LAAEERSLLAVFIYFVNFDTPEWMVLEKVDDREELTNFLQSEKRNNFSLGKVYFEFVAQYPKRNIIIDKNINILIDLSLRGRVSMWDRSSVMDIRIVHAFVLSYTPYFHIFE
jgi:hypothetical protein